MNYIKQFSEEDWFLETRELYTRRVKSLVERFVAIERFVSFEPGNGETYSYEFAGIMRDAGAFFGSFMDELVKHKQNPPDRMRYYQMLCMAFRRRPR